MRTFLNRQLLVQLLLAAGALSCIATARDPHLPARAANAAATGIPLEEVKHGSLGDKAGLQAGDLLLAWRLPAMPPNARAEGRFCSPFDVYEVEREQAPRGVITLTGRRGDAPMHWIIAAKEGWGVRPGLPLSSRKDSYRQGLERFAAGDVQGGAASLRRSEAALERSGDFESASWVALREGQLADEHGAWDAAQEGVAAALRIARLHCSPTVVSHVDYFAAIAYGRHEQLQRAGELLENALALREKVAPASISSTAILSLIAYTRSRQGDIAGAERALHTALEITRRLAPDSWAFAKILSNLGIVLSSRGDLAGAEEHPRRALELDEELSPDSLYLADDLVVLGKIARKRNDPTAAEAYERRALELRRRLAPDSEAVGKSLTDVALSLVAQDNLSEAESYWRQACLSRHSPCPAPCHRGS